MPRSETKCPHANIIHCPLYHACHDTRFSGSGCDDGKWDQGGCAVDRGMDYGAAVATMRAIDPRLIAEMEFAEAAEQSQVQRRRNMRAAGLH